MEARIGGGVCAKWLVGDLESSNHRWAGLLLFSMGGGGGGGLERKREKERERRETRKTRRGRGPDSNVPLLSALACVPFLFSRRQFCP